MLYLFTHWIKILIASLSATKFSITSVFIMFFYGTVKSIRWHLCLLSLFSHVIHKNSMCIWVFLLALENGYWKVYFVVKFRAQAIIFLSQNVFLLCIFKLRFQGNSSSRYISDIQLCTIIVPYSHISTK